MNTQQPFVLVEWASLPNWSVRFAIENRFAYNPDFEIRRIGSFLKRTREEVSIQDEEFYQRVTVKINGKGVIQRDVVQGKEIGTKKQFKLHSGQFLLSRIDARHGAFGMAPEELEGAILTNDFPAYNLDHSIIEPKFFVLVTSTSAFMRFCQNCSTGTTNRQRLDEALFLNVEIPLPALREQALIVSEYESDISRAIGYRNKAAKLRSEAEEFFLTQLGLSLSTAEEKSTGWQFINYSYLVDRWDYLSTSGAFVPGLLKAKYPLLPLGVIYDFISRAWKPQDANGTFKYVEIGSVDPDAGITEARELKVKDAPSRASQIIKEGDLIIATTRPYLRKFALVTSEYNDCVCSSGFSVINKSDKYDLSFLKEFLFSAYGIGQIRERMTGALYPAITEPELRGIRLPLPPNVNEQKSIMEEVTRKRALANSFDSKAEALELKAKKSFENKIFI